MADAVHCRGNAIPSARRYTTGNAASLFPSDLDRQALVLSVARQWVLAEAEPLAAYGSARPMVAKPRPRTFQPRIQSAHAVEVQGLKSLGTSLTNDSPTVLKEA